MEYALYGWSLTIREKGSSEKKDQTQKTPSRGRNSTREDTEAIQRALDRFSASPPPTGIPESIEPPPTKIELDWMVKGVSKSVQDKVSEIVTRKGEFGYLPQERVDEIATQIEGMNITLEQALSLRAALNQENIFEVLKARPGGKSGEERNSNPNTVLQYLYSLALSQQPCPLRSRQGKVLE